jgi:hypothetical protein
MPQTSTVWSALVVDVGKGGLAGLELHEPCLLRLMPI